MAQCNSELGRQHEDLVPHKVAAVQPFLQVRRLEPLRHRVLSLQPADFHPAKAAVRQDELVIRAGLPENHKAFARIGAVVFLVEVEQQLVVADLVVGRVQHDGGIVQPQVAWVIEVVDAHEGRALLLGLDHGLRCAQQMGIAVSVAQEGHEKKVFAELPDVAALERDEVAGLALADLHGVVDFVCVCPQALHDA
ncbi:hypothetical protein ABW21_db0207048 [Orbilia brochopaga]|nr:hypothetical protein ABW21_db0207048 [Drechslerella brochopaga]